MDPQVSGSFIPKKPLVETRRASGAGVGLFLLLAVLLFVLSLVGAAGVFAYQSILQTQLVDKDKSLKADEAAFEPSTIADLARLDSRISHTQSLLKNHVAPSAIFDYLATITLQKVQLTDFSYKLNADGSADLGLSGVGDSFSTVALQSDQFGSSTLLKDVAFSNVAIAQAGSVTFSVTATLDPSLYVYTREPGAAAAATAQPTSSSTPTP